MRRSRLPAPGLSPCTRTCRDETETSASQLKLPEILVVAAQGITMRRTGKHFSFLQQPVNCFRHLRHDYQSQIWTIVRSPHLVLPVSCRPLCMLSCASIQKLFL